MVSIYPGDENEEAFDSRMFYELCQAYRHSKNNDRTVAAFEALKEFGRAHAAEQTKNLREATRRLVAASMVAMTDESLATVETAAAWNGAMEALEKVRGAA